MALLTDLADYRLLRAVRAGQLGAFPTLWNAHAGSIWSVARGLCGSDTEALGWVTSFRVDLERDIRALDPEQRVAPQLGAALLQHLAPGFPATTPLPPSPLPPTEAGLRGLPERARLLYLVSLFFDLEEEDLLRVAGMDASMLVRLAATAIEPGSDTGAHLAIHAALLRAAPAGALVLPPGSEAPPRPSRLPWLAALAFLLLLAATSVYVRNVLFPTTWDDLADEHAATLAAQGLLLESDAALLAARLSADGVPSVLSEVPTLRDLSPVGARILDTSPPEVILVYTSRSELWTLQHRLRAAPDPTNILAIRHTPREDLVAVGTHTSPLVAWSEGDYLWVLSASVSPERLLDTAGALYNARAAVSVPWPG